MCEKDSNFSYFMQIISSQNPMQPQSTFESKYNILQSEKIIQLT